MPTFRDYRRRIAQDVGGLFHGSTVVSATSSSIVDTKFPIKTALDVADLYSGKYLLRPEANADADRVRFVAELGYDAATGTLRADLAWTDGGPITGEIYELHGIIEPWTTMLDLVNSALRRCFLVDELALAPTVSARRHGLTTVAPWLRTPRWVRQIGVVRDNADRNERDPFDRPFRGTIQQQGASVYVSHPDRTYDPTTDTLYARVIKPAYYHCRASSVAAWGTQSGLTDDDSEAPCDEEWVAAAALIYFWERYGDVVGGGEAGDVKLSLAKAAAAFTDLTRENFELPPRNLIETSPLTRWGPVPSY